MEIAEINPGVIAFIRPDEGANAGLIRTADGAVVVDTTSWPANMRGLLNAAGVAASEARLVINTHAHADHTWGNQLLDCPILAHRLCRARMEANLSGAWSAEAIAAYIAELEKTDPDQAHEVREKLVDLCITLPTETFDERRDLESSGVRIEVIHVGAHTPGSAVVWLSEVKVLFAGDLIFEGRYPYLGDADVPALIAALKRLPQFRAQVIVPGHGRLCGEPEIAALANYLETTWARTAHHVTRGHSEEEAATDPDCPRYAETGTERFHKENIRLMYIQLTSHKESNP